MKWKPSNREIIRLTFVINCVIKPVCQLKCELMIVGCSYSGVSEDKGKAPQTAKQSDACFANAAMGISANFQVGFLQFIEYIVLTL